MLEQAVFTQRMVYLMQYQYGPGIVPSSTIQCILGGVSEIQCIMGELSKTRWQSKENTRPEQLPKSFSHRCHMLYLDSTSVTRQD